MEIKDIISSGLLEMYVLGLTTAEETATVESWIRSYPEVAEEIRDIEQGMEIYAMSHKLEPGSSVKNNILARLAQGQGNNRQTIPAQLYPISRAWKWVAASSIILLVGSAILNVVYYDKFIRAKSAYTQTKQVLIAQNEKIAGMDKDMGIVQNKYSMAVALNGLPAAPDAAAKIFWMKNTGEVYIDPTNLPEPPKGKQYQLWAIVDGQPVDGGMININATNGKTYHIQKMKSFGKAEAFAVTLEKEGGNTTPQGEMYVLGKL